MANTYATEADLYLNNTPAQMADGATHGGRLRVYRATIPTDGTHGLAATDTVTLAKLPAGSSVMAILMATTNSTGSATVSIGTAASAALYKTAAAFTTTTGPVLFGLPAGIQAAALTADTEILATIGTAALPDNSGTLTVDIIVANG